MRREIELSMQGIWGRLASKRASFLGMGLIWAWIYCTFDMAASTSPVPSADPNYLAMLAFVALSLIGLAVVLRDDDISRFSRLRIIAPIMVSLGTVVPWACAGLGMAGAALFAIHCLCDAVIGFGYAWLCIAWADVMTRLDSEQVEVAVPSASGVLVACAFLFPSLNEVVGTVVAALLPLASGLLLAAAHRTAGEDAPETKPLAEASVSRAFDGWELARVLVALALLCAAICFVEAENASLRSNEAPFDLPGLFGGLAGVGLAVAVTLFSVSIDFSALTRWLVPLVVGGIAALAVNPHDAAPWCAAIMAGADVCIQVVVYLYFIRLARFRRLPIALGIGLGQGFLQLGVLAGNAVVALGGALPLADSALSTACLIAIVVIVAGSALLPARVRSLCEGLSGKPCQEACCELSDGETVSNAPIDAAVGALADAYGLSNREAEILGYLARGRSQPYIREALVLSKSTVSTHVRHIYGKLDVHSRQELLDKLEAAAR